MISKFAFQPQIYEKLTRGKPKSCFLTLRIPKKTGKPHPNAIWISITLNHDILENFAKMSAKKKIMHIFFAIEQF